MTALASRLLAEVRGAVARGWCAPANSTKVMDTDLAEAIAQEVCALMQAEAAAALSAPEGDMARALEWVRAMVGDNAGSRMHLPAIEEAIAAYDPERAGAFSGKLSAPESLKAVTQLEWSATLCDGKNVDYATAEKACAALGEGWRLPTVEELFALADRTRSEPAIDTEVFPNTESDWYWSSTITARSSVRAWCVSFSDGNAFNYRRDDNVCCVRAVRSVPSGQHAAAPSAKGVV